MNQLDGAGFLRLWANKLICAAVATYLAFVSREVPWLPKLTAISIAVGGGFAGEMLRKTGNGTLPMLVAFASACGAVAAINFLVPQRLMAEFRARAGGPVIQSYVGAYFELVLLVTAAAIAIAVWRFILQW
ncbi:hypothetical protein PV773_08110 [Mesorhizobium sp. CC13]|uniref:hypothetical protein n=1 Tax=Mesorhizobium sp. CC13 TaxID=3029194 RepID=UPI003264FA06